MTCTSLHFRKGKTRLLKKHRCKEFVSKGARLNLRHFNPSPNTDLSRLCPCCYTLVPVCVGSLLPFSGPRLDPVPVSVDCVGGGRDGLLPTLGRYHRMPTDVEVPRRHRYRQLVTPVEEDSHSGVEVGLSTFVTRDS